MSVREVVADDPVRLPEQVRAAANGVAAVLVRIAEGGDPLIHAQMLASIGPLAIELAPAIRVNALVIAAGADPAHVEHAARWLGAALSTTGQVLRITPKA